jgi:hypothetical protein
MAILPMRDCSAQACLAATSLPLPFFLSSWWFRPRVFLTQTCLLVCFPCFLRFPSHFLVLPPRDSSLAVTIKRGDCVNQVATAASMETVKWER